MRAKLCPAILRRWQTLDNPQGYVRGTKALLLQNSM